MERRTIEWDKVRGRKFWNGTNCCWYIEYSYNGFYGYGHTNDTAWANFIRHYENDEPNTQITDDIK